MTNKVGAGKVAPKSANISEKTGITKTRIIAITIIATIMVMIGYIIAPLTWRLSLAIFSI